MAAASKTARIPRVQRVRRWLSTGAWRDHYYHRGARKVLPSPENPAFDAAYAAAEAVYAAQLAAQQSAQAPHAAAHPDHQSPSAAGPANQLPAAPPPPRRAASGTRKLVTQARAQKTARRRAAVTQAEIARVIRAAKQAGAVQVEVRLSDSSAVLIRLEPDNSVAPNEEIIL